MQLEWVKRHQRSPDNLWSGLQASSTSIGRVSSHPSAHVAIPVKVHTSSHKHIFFQPSHLSLLPDLAVHYCLPRPGTGGIALSNSRSHAVHLQNATRFHKIMGPCGQLSNFHIWKFMIWIRWCNLHLDDSTYNMGSWTFLHHLQQLMCPWQHYTSVYTYPSNTATMLSSCNYVAQWSDPQVIHIPVMVRMNQSLVQVQYHDLSTHRNYRITSIFWCQTSVAIHRTHNHASHFRTRWT